jgi:hypothetical protein
MDAARGDRRALLADHRNYCKVEKLTKEGRIERMLYAGNDLDKAREIFTAAIKYRPRIRAWGFLGDLLLN